MLPVEALGLIVVLVTAFALAAIVVIVVAGIRHEEQELSMTRKRPPSVSAAITRRIVGLYVRKTDPPGCDSDTGDRECWCEPLR